MLFRFSAKEQQYSDWFYQLCRSLMETSLLAVHEMKQNYSNLFRFSESKGSAVQRAFIQIIRDPLN